MKKAAIAVLVGLLLTSVLGGCSRLCNDPCAPICCGEPCKVVQKQYVCCE